MARDPDLLDRMYGDRPPRPRPRGDVGALPAAWITALLLAALAAGVVSVAILFAALLAPEPPLARWGVIEPEEWLLAVHDHSPAGDGTAGCALTSDRVVRFDGRVATASVGLRGAEVDVGDGRVEVRDPDGATVECPFDPGEDPARFAAEVRRRVRPVPPPPPPPPEGAIPQGR